MSATGSDNGKGGDKHKEELSNAALSSASSLMGLQVFSRIVTFVLNQALVRLATPQQYGTVSIQLEPVLITILFLSREGFRNALLRADEGTVDEGKTNRNDTERSLRVSNLALLPIYLGIPIALATVSAYYASASAAVKEQPYFSVVVILYAVAALVDLASEPMHIRCVTSFCYFMPSVG
jgi:oligosaccharide translocation protein RFT1